MKKNILAVVMMSAIAGTALGVEGPTGTSWKDRFTSGWRNASEYVQDHKYYQAAQLFYYQQMASLSAAKAAVFAGCERGAWKRNVAQVAANVKENPKDAGRLLAAGAVAATIVYGTYRTAKWLLFSKKNNDRK